MAKKKIKASKTKKQAQENRYFMGALMIIGGLFVIGIAAVMLFGNTGASLVSGGGGHDSQIKSDMETRYGAKWRSLGITDWLYNPSDTMFYVDWTKWSGLSVAERKSRMNQAGKDFGRLLKEHGGDPKSVFVMFHDSVNRNAMIGTYSGLSGAQIQE